MISVHDNRVISECVSPSDRIDLCLSRTRALCDAMIEDGAYGREIAYSLTYFATLLALYQTDNSAKVIPDLLRGMADAAADRTKEYRV